MADTVESLRADINKLRGEFEAFLHYAKPTIDAHQLPPPGEKPLLTFPPAPPKPPY